MNDIIREVARIVEKACRADTNSYGYSIWTHHIGRVVANGRRLAELHDADPEIVELAALLHDYAAIKDLSLATEHHIHGAAEAKEILQRLNYPPGKIREVQNCIYAHRGSKPVKRESVEARCLADADAMAHMQTVPSLLHYAYVGKGLSTDEGALWVRRKLQRSWQKMTRQGRELVQETYEAALRMLE